MVTLWFPISTVTVFNKAISGIDDGHTVADGLTTLVLMTTKIKLNKICDLFSLTLITSYEHGWQIGLPLEEVLGSDEYLTVVVEGKT